MDILFSFFLYDVCLFLLHTALTLSSPVNGSMLWWRLLDPSFDVYHVNLSLLLITY
jgi:hypothetical protein